MLIDEQLSQAVGGWATLREMFAIEAQEQGISPERAALLFAALLAPHGFASFIQHVEEAQLNRVVLDRLLDASCHAARSQTVFSFDS